MNNEEKILKILETMQGQIGTMQGQMSKMDARLDRLESDVKEMREDVEVIKEDIQVTRVATNTLLDWAEKVEVQIRIPLYNKAK